MWREDTTRVNWELFDSLVIFTLPSRIFSCAQKPKTNDSGVKTRSNQHVRAQYIKNHRWYYEEKLVVRCMQSTALLFFVLFFFKVQQKLSVSVWCRTENNYVNVWRRRGVTLPPGISWASEKSKKTQSLLECDTFVRRNCDQKYVNFFISD